MNKRTYDPSWCRALRDETVKRERRGRTRRTAEERFDDWLWSDEVNLCRELKPQNIEILYRDSIGRTSARLVTVESVIEKSGGIYLKTWCHTKDAERTFRVSDVLEITDPDTGEVFLDVPAWLASARRL
jgi:hypothetical protein